MTSSLFQFDWLGTDPRWKVDRSSGTEVDSHQLGVSGSATDQGFSILLHRISLDALRFIRMDLFLRWMKLFRRKTTRKINKFILLFKWRCFIAPYRWLNCVQCFKFVIQIGPTELPEALLARKRTKFKSSARGVYLWVSDNEVQFIYALYLTSYHLYYKVHLLDRRGG